MWGRARSGITLSHAAMLWLALGFLALAEVIGAVYYFSSASSSPRQLSPQQIALGELSLAKRHDPPDAVLGAYENYLAGYPADAQTRMEFAALLEKQSQPSAAISQYQTVSRQEPRNVEALKGLARCHTALGHHDLAALHLEEACRIRPDDAALLKELGLACHRAGDPGRAMEALHRSLAADPNQQDLFPLIAQIAQGKVAGSVGDDLPSSPRRAPGGPWNTAAVPNAAPHVPGPVLPRPVDPMRFGVKDR